MHMGNALRAYNAIGHLVGRFASDRYPVNSHQHVVHGDFAREAAGPPGMTFVTKRSPCHAQHRVTPTRGARALDRAIGSQTTAHRCKRARGRKRHRHQRHAQRRARAAGTTSGLTLMLQPMPHMTPEVGGVGISPHMFAPAPGDTVPRPGDGAG